MHDAGDTDLETCCVCLDSLSSASVTLLLDSENCKRACSHFIHYDCAALLTPRRCPLCRASFVALTAPIHRSVFSSKSPPNILRGLRRVAGLSTIQSGEPSAPTLDVIGLLVATLPKPEDSIRAAVVAVTGTQVGELEVGVGQFEDLLEVLGVRASSSPTPSPELADGDVVLSQSSGLQAGAGYSMATRLSRRINWLMLKMTGVVGSALFCGGCGTSIGILTGGAFAVPVHRWPDLEGNSSQIEIALKIGWIFCLVAYYGAQRKDLVMSGLRWGSAFGFIFGCCHGLVYVNPENHGLRSVFWRGLSGQTTIAILQGRGSAHQSRSRVDVDVFSSCG